MQLEDYFDFLEPDVIRLKGHRLGIEHIVEYYHDGYSAEQIAQTFPGLALEQVYGVLAYYLHNKAELDGYIARINQEAEESYQAWLGNLPPFSQRLREIKAQRDQERQQHIS